MQWRNRFITYEPFLIFNNPFIFHQTLKQNGKSSWIYNGRYSLSVEWWFKLCSDLEWCIPSAVQGLGTSSKNHWGQSFYRELFAVSLWNPICQVDGLLPHSDLHTLQVFLHSNILICFFMHQFNEWLLFSINTFQFNRGDIVGKFLVESWSYSCQGRLRCDNCVDNDYIDGIYKRCSSKNILRQINWCISWILLFYGVCFPLRYVI